MHTNADSISFVLKIGQIPKNGQEKKTINCVIKTAKFYKILCCFLSMT